VIFQPTDIEGAFLIKIEPHHDERGFFARTFCTDEFEEQGLAPSVAQCNVSFNHKRGTLRGMHSQKKPHEETKVVRCTRGAIHDVIVDLRSDSPSFLKHYAVDLTCDDRLALYVPRGVFHGFQTLMDSTEVFYQMSRPFVPGVGSGYRWSDPAFSIRWPIEVSVISRRDASYPDYEPI